MFLTSVYRAKLVFCIILKTGFVARKLFLSSADSPTSVAGGTCATECICEAANVALQQIIPSMEIILFYLLTPRKKI